MSQVLMPKATAVWLVENTTLTFDQISAFTGLHPLEVQAIADGEVAGGMTGLDPTTNGQLTKEEIKRAEADPGRALKLSPRDVPDAGGPLQGAALHAGRQAPGSARRHRLAAQDPSRAAGLARSPSWSARPRAPSSRCATAPTGTCRTCVRAIR